MKGFRKLAHATRDEIDRITTLKTKISVLVILLEFAMKYDNRDQLIIAQIELERYKLELEKEFCLIYTRAGNFPAGGQVEMHKSGDVIEYFVARK